MPRLKFSQLGDPNKFELDNIYMIDGREVTAREHIEKGMEISLVQGQALVKSAWDDKRNKLVQDLITNPYKSDADKNGYENES